MKKIFIAAAAALCAGALFAQVSAEKGKAVEEPEESVVMIDSRTDAEDMRTTAANAEDRALPAGLPSSYGQCRGVITEGGRSVLVFESPEDGSMAFVQVTLGKANVSWKLLDRIYRSAD
jgi:hypothetical protein